MSKNRLSFEILCVTMHQTDFSKLTEMNIRSNAVFSNQADRTAYEEYEFDGHKAKMITTATRGVGVNRNLALTYASADLLLLADDDIRYCDECEEIVLNAFESNPKADVILFNFESLNPDRPEAITQKTHRVRWYNALKYGAFRIAVRREALLRKNITFSRLFGGGTRHSAGEDNLFITNCLQAGLRVISHTAVLGTVRQEESTWFRGYNEKYYRDRGALFAAMYGRWAKTMLLLFECKKIRNGFRRRLALGFDGIKAFRKY